uniref:Uncharacterized protein n=1 Tax=Oryza sativa subsp. japonica TaxID=39947 RepID=Q6ESV4_ORYSJ|nr:hypothetical protein [Oryza sativa Japonica Group]
MTRFANTPFDMCHSSPVQRFVSKSSVINSCLWVLGSDNFINTGARPQGDHGSIRWMEDQGRPMNFRGPVRKSYPNTKHKL